MGPRNQPRRGRPSAEAAGPPAGRPLSLDAAAPWPVFECLIAAGWRDTSRLAEILVAKEPPFGGVVTCAVQVDLACLGPKWAFVSQFRSRRDYEEQFRSLMLARCGLVPVEYCLVAKVLWDSLRYARRLGIEPPPEVTSTLSALGPIDQAAAACSETIPLGGADGRPHYMAGPDDDTDLVLATLTRTCGAGNFVFAVPTGPIPADFFDSGAR